jgi:hypothetical protein
MIEPRTGGYVMAKLVDISNFKGFADLSLPDCRRVNIVVGQNGSGKTALLEAVFLAQATSAEHALRIKSWRGYDPSQVTGSQREIDDALWGDLFHQFERGIEARINVHGGPPHHNRELTIKLSQRTEVVVPISRSASSGYMKMFPLPPTPLTFQWKSPNEPVAESTVTLEDGKFKFTRAPSPKADVIIFPANQPVNTAELMNRFSNLSKAFAEEEVIATFRNHFPDIEGISIEAAAGTPMLFAKVHGYAKKLPMSLLSGGMNKLAAILFAIPNASRGIVLVDEIESGFYYKLFPKIWTALHAFSVKFDTQLFVSTHSDECLNGAAEVAAEHPKDFSIVRTTKRGEKCTAKQFGGEAFANAVDATIDVR